MATYQSIPIPLKGLFKNNKVLNFDITDFCYENKNLILDKGSLRVRPGGDIVNIEGEIFHRIFKIYQNNKVFVTAEKKLYEITAPSLKDNQGIQLTPVLDINIPISSYLEFSLPDTGEKVVIFNSADNNYKYSLIDGSFNPLAINTPGNKNKLVKMVSYFSKIFAITGKDTQLWFSPDDGIFNKEWKVIDLLLSGISMPIVDLETTAYDKLNSANNRLILLCNCDEYSLIKIYQGTDPTSATSWGEQANFRLPRAISDKPLIKTKNDLIIITEQGLFSLNELFAGNNEPLTTVDNILLEDNEIAKDAYYASDLDFITIEIYNKDTSTYKASLLFQPSYNYLCETDRSFLYLVLANSVGERVYISNNCLYKFIKEATPDIDKVNFVFKSNFFTFANPNNKKITLNLLSVSGSDITNIRCYSTLWDGTNDYHSAQQAYGGIGGLWDIDYWYNEEDNIPLEEAVGALWDSPGFNKLELIYYANAVGERINFVIEGNCAAGSLVIHSLQTRIIVGNEILR